MNLIHRIARANKQQQATAPLNIKELMPVAQAEQTWLPPPTGLAVRLQQAKNQPSPPLTPAALVDQPKNRKSTVMPAAKLLALHGHVQPIEYSLESDICTIGRDELCHIVVPLKTVSRLHAKIERKGSHYRLYDTHSVNGTFVNGRQIQEPYELQDQDVIGLSADSALLRFEDPDSTLVLIPRLRLDWPRMIFLLDETSLELSPTQFRLLRHLYLNAGIVCSQTSCAEAMWGRDYPGLDQEALEQQVNALQLQLQRVDPGAALIETRPGLGYRLNL
jgi:hypothetical protein